MLVKVHSFNQNLSVPPPSEKWEFAWFLEDYTNFSKKKDK